MNDSMNMKKLYSQLNRAIKDAHDYSVLKLDLFSQMKQGDKLRVKRISTDDQTIPPKLKKFLSQMPSFSQASFAPLLKCIEVAYREDKTFRELDHRPATHIILVQRAALVGSKTAATGGSSATESFPFDARVFVPEVFANENKDQQENQTVICLQVPVRLCLTVPADKIDKIPTGAALTAQDNHWLQRILSFGTIDASSVEVRSVTDEYSGTLRLDNSSQGTSNDSKQPSEDAQPAAAGTNQGARARSSPLGDNSGPQSESKTPSGPLGPQSEGETPEQNIPSSEPSGPSGPTIRAI